MLARTLLTILLGFSPLALASGVISLHGQFKKFDQKYYYFTATDKTEHKIKRAALEKILKPKLYKTVSLTLPEQIVSVSKPAKRKVAGRR